MDKFFAVQAPGDPDIDDFRNFLRALTVPPASAEMAPPPRVLVIWPKVLVIETVLTELEFQYRVFAGDGSALIYTATCGFEEILVYNEADLRRYIRNALEASPERPVLVDRFLEDATEVDVDCISDGETAVIGAIMEHRRECVLHQLRKWAPAATGSVSDGQLLERFNLDRRTRRLILGQIENLRRADRGRGLAFGGGTGDE